MNAVRNFAFGDLLIRVVDHVGEPWFVASDVCAALDIQNPTVAVKILDEEDKSKLNLGLRGSDALIISEPGLYTLMMRSNKAVDPETSAYRFRRWVTREVLPTLRKTGSYTMVAEPEEVTEELDESDMMLKLAFVREARRTFGRDAAKRAWVAVGLPPVGSSAEGAAIAYDEASNPEVEQWLRQRTEPAPGQWVESSALYEDFARWSRMNGLRLVSGAAFGADLRRLGFEPWKYGRIRRRGLRLMPVGRSGGASLQ